MSIPSRIVENGRQHASKTIPLRSFTRNISPIIVHTSVLLHSGEKKHIVLDSYSECIRLQRQRFRSFSKTPCAVRSLFPSLPTPRS